MKQNFIGIIVIALLIISCDTTKNNDTKNNDTKDKTTVIIPKEWKEVNEGIYHMFIPEEWVVEKKNKGYKFILYAPKTSKKDKYRENINLKSEKLPENTPDLKHFINYKINKLKDRTENQSEISIQDVSHDGRDFKILTYSGTTSGYQLKYEKHIWIEHDDAYILTFTAEEKEFDNYKDVVNKIIASITE